MKKIFLTLVAISISILTFSQGFIWNDKVKKELESTFQEIETNTRSYYPSSYSLDRYTPYVLHQGESGMCVAYALANCRTIIYAKNRNLSGKDEISDNSFSPFFLYYQVKGKNDNKCELGLSPADALMSIMDGGIAQIYDVEYPDYWPFTNKQLCTYYPPSYSTDKNNASRYKIDEPRTFNEGLSTSEKISALKYEISSGNPIFFGMDPFPGSLWASIGVNTWNPESSVQCMGVTQTEYQCERQVKYDGYCYQHKNQIEGVMGHAMVIIAYDNDMYGGAFQILNSYGTGWGNNGKIWIRYNDVIKYSVLFYSISRKYETSSFGMPSAKNIPLTNDSIDNFGSPSFIENGLEPPWSQYLKQE